jgi:signal transduction histidine kinase
MASRDGIIHKDLTLKLALSWVGSAAAFGWPIIIWVAFWPLITGSNGGQIPGSNLPIDIHAYDLISGLLPAAVLILFRYAFKANRPADFSGSVLKNLAVQAWAAVIGVSLTLFLVSLAGEIPVEYLVGVPIGIASTWGQIFGFTVVTIAVADLRAATKQLARKTHRLRFLMANLEQRVIEQGEALQLEVEVRMGEQVKILREQLEELQSGADRVELASQLAARIGATIDEVVRPLSLELANSVTKDTRAEMRTLRQLERQISRLPFGQRMSLPINLSAVFNVPFAAILLLVFMVPTYGYLFGTPAMFQVAVPATVGTVLLIWLARRATGRVQTNYALALVSVLVGAVIAAVPFSILNGILLTNQNQQLLDFSAFGAFLVIAFVCYGSLFYHAAYQILDRVRDANLELRKLVAFLQNAFQINRRKLAQVVHGKIQARLQAASIRLKQADKITDELIASLQEDLNAAVLDSADTRLDAETAEVLLTEMADQWSGICDLTFSFVNRVSDLVNNNSTLKAAVVEVVREAVNNAVKHGDADEADIVITSSAPDTVNIEIRNAVYSTGSAADDRGRGYGSQLLDQITESWSVKFEDGDAIFEATISVGGISL